MRLVRGIGNTVACVQGEVTLAHPEVHLTFEDQPDLFAFVEAGLNQREYKVAALSDGIRRDSTGDRYRVGLSFGGWLAAEIAVKNTSRMAALCLVDTLGAKFSGPMTRDITDLFSWPQYQHAQWIYHDEKLQHPNYRDMSDEMATKLDIEFYQDGRDALLKALAE